VKNFIQVKCYLIFSFEMLMSLYSWLATWIFEGIADMEWVMTNRFFTYSSGLNEYSQNLYENRLNVHQEKQSLMGPLKITKVASLEDVEMISINNKISLINKEELIDQEELVDTYAISNEYNLSNKDNSNKNAILINQVAAGIAHEINNPLGFVSSNLDTLQEYADSLKEILMQQQQLINRFSTQKTLSAIEIMALQNDAEVNYILDDLDDLISESITGVTRVKKVVEDFSMVSHIDLLDTSDEDVNKILELSLAQIIIPPNRHIKFVKEYGDIMMTKVNAQKINKAFIALISNAVQAVKINGNIILRTTQLKHHVRIDVIDNGCGIPEEALKTIFDPFYTTRNVGEGIGLGLHMAQNSAQSHGGALTVSSKEGVGTVLTMILPVSDCGAAISDWPIDTQLSL